MLYYLLSDFLDIFLLFINIVQISRIMITEDLIRISCNQGKILLILVNVIVFS